MRQSWDYKWISVSRPVGQIQWTGWWEDDRPLAAPVSIGGKIKELGDQGWELVAVTPVSNQSGSGFAGQQITTDYAGFTNQVNYFFKRPK